MNTKTSSLKVDFNDNFITIDGIMSFFSYKTVKDLSNESGIDTKEISKVIKEMVKRGYVVKRGRAYKYPNGR